MSEIQFAGLSLVFLGGLPAFLLANYIEKNKHYSLFSGWDPARISDEDACGKMMCHGLRVFAMVMGLGGASMLVLNTGSNQFIVALVIFSAAPLLYYTFKARKLYFN